MATRSPGHPGPDAQLVASPMATGTADPGWASPVRKGRAPDVRTHRSAAAYRRTSRTPLDRARRRRLPWCPGRHALPVALPRARPQRLPGRAPPALPTRRGGSVGHRATAGANVKVVQRMLGHASAAMTLDVYAGLFGDDLDAVADRLDAAVRRAAADYLQTSAPPARNHQTVIHPSHRG